MHIKGKDEGQRLMDQVIQHFGLREPQYFGLSYAVDHSTYCWLEAEKTLSHQFNCKKASIVS